MCMCVHVCIHLCLCVWVFVCARIHTVPDRGCLTTYSPLVRTATQRGQGGPATQRGQGGPSVTDATDASVFSAAGHLNTSPRLDDSSDTPRLDHKSHTRPQDTTRLVHTAQQGRPDMYRHTRVLMCINIHMFHNDLYRYTHVSHGHTDV